MSIRHDWYQSDSKVVITVLLKNASELDYKVNIEKDKVEVTTNNYNLELNLYRPIDPTKSSYKATSTKIEINLSKLNAERWEKLEHKIDEDMLKKPEEEEINGNKNKWDKLAKEIVEEENQETNSEEALQNLFKKIYSESTEDVKRAMNKSFLESGGTVLSTNWKEVSERPVDVKPPNGTEFKTWNK